MLFVTRTSICVYNVKTIIWQVIELNMWDLCTLVLVIHLPQGILILVLFVEYVDLWLLSILFAYIL